MSLLVKVGNFAKSTGVATATQAITGVGFIPKCLILWTSGGTVDGTIQTQATRDARACIGYASGTAAADQYCAGFEADTAGAGGRQSRQCSVLLVDAAGVPSSLAVLASFDADGFTLSWTTNNTGEAQIVHYIALGGDIQAKVRDFTSPGSAGNYSVTGVGFAPTFVLSVSSVGSVNSALGACVMRVGAGTGGSARWVRSIQSDQAVSSAGWRWQRNDRLVLHSNNAGVSVTEQDLVSLDADGATFNQIANTGVRAPMLFLRGPGVAVGNFVKPTGGGPAVGTISGLPFPPALVFLASNEDVARANAASQTGARLGISAFTGVGAESSVLSIPNAPNPLTFAYLEKSAKAAVKIDNATPAIDAEATAVLTGDGFALTWNANDAVATELSYFALGEVPLPKGTGRVTQRRHSANRSRLPRGAWRRRAA